MSFVHVLPVTNGIRFFFHAWQKQEVAFISQLSQNGHLITIFLQRCTHFLNNFRTAAIMGEEDMLYFPFGSTEQ